MWGGQKYCLILDSGRSLVARLSAVRILPKRSRPYIRSVGSDLKRSNAVNINPDLSKFQPYVALQSPTRDLFSTRVTLAKIHVTQGIGARLCNFRTQPPHKHIKSNSVSVRWDFIFGPIISALASLWLGYILDPVGICLKFLCHVRLLVQPVET